MNPSGRRLRQVSVIVLLSLPLVLQSVGSHWVRMLDTCLLYVMLALGMNIIVGFAGLLDLGFIAFYAVGAYVMALLTSPHLGENFAGLAAMAPGGLHLPWWGVVPVGIALATGLGVLIGAPTLKLRGDYLAMVTLGFGEIIRLLIINLNDPWNLTNGAKGIGPIAPIPILGLTLDKPLRIAGHEVAPVTLHAYLFLVLVGLTATLCRRAQASRTGRAWMAIRDDEVAAEAMGINTRNLKLLAFGLGASLGGLAGALFAGFQGFISPEAFSLQESIMVVAMVVFGGIGNIPGVIAGAVLLAALPEALRYVAGPLQSMTDGRLDAGMLRPLLISLAMIITMLLRPNGLWPRPAPDRSSMTFPRPPRP